MSLFQNNGALFNEDRTERYLLWRIWDTDKPLLLVVCLNPSTANEYKNDATISRCVNYSKANGYGGLYFCNLFPIRSTDPKVLYKGDPYSLRNEQEVLKIRANITDCVVAWGTHGNINDYGKRMASLLAPLKCFGINNDGTPKHPCRFLRDSTPMVSYEYALGSDHLRIGG